MFDTTLKKEIRKKCLPEPNPQKVSIPRFATIMMVLEKVRDLYIGGGTRVAMPPPRFIDLWFCPPPQISISLSW